VKVVTLVTDRRWQVAKKRRVGKFPKAFWEMAVARLRSCDNISTLAKELGVHRRLLYTWRDKLEALESADGSPPPSQREATLRKEINQLKRVLADKTVEADFFKGALREVQARRPRSGGPGGTASTPTSGT
jgi:transposase-like protein